MILLASGCSHVQTKDPDFCGHEKYASEISFEQTLPAKTAKLKSQLMSLGSNTDEKEAELTAETAVHAALSLIDEYELIKPPTIHNFLVNIGLKERGLCVHWTEDILKKLRSLNLKTFDFYWAVARPIAPWRLDHSSVVVTAKGGVFKEGLVLDAWRKSGCLYWVHVKDDDYDWQLLENE
ncbi:MAG: hypothetical protein LLF28_03490 [Nitrospiraceae bacterium]|nr:hypothetical protein [Nitrospiraceae bacterium]